MNSEITKISFIIFFVAAVWSLPIGAAKGADPSFYSIHVASHKRQADAERQVRQFQAKGYESFFERVEIPDKGEWYRVYLGHYESREKASSFAAKLKTEGMIESFFIHRLEEGLKIGVIDFHRIFQESRAGKNSRETFIREVEGKRAVLKAKQDEVLASEEEFKKASEGLSPSEKQERADALAREMKDLGRLRNDLEEALKERDLEMTKRHLDEIRRLVKTFFEKEGYTLIVDKKTVIASDPSIDVTDRIIELYDNGK